MLSVNLRIDVASRVVWQVLMPPAPPTQALIPPTGLRLDDEPRRAGEPTLPHSGSPLPSRVVWQLFTLMIISKGSGYGLSSHLLRAVMPYLNTQWQAVVANSAQATGPYSSMDWLPSDAFQKALWG